MTQPIARCGNKWTSTVRDEVCWRGAKIGKRPAKGGAGVRHTRAKGGKQQRYCASARLAELLPRRDVSLIPAANYVRASNIPQTPSPSSSSPSPSQLSLLLLIIISCARVDRDGRRARSRQSTPISGIHPPSDATALLRLSPRPCISYCVREFAIHFVVSFSHSSIFFELLFSIATERANQPAA